MCTPLAGDFEILPVRKGWFTIRESKSSRHTLSSDYKRSVSSKYKLSSKYDAEHDSVVSLVSSSM